MGAKHRAAALRRWRRASERRSMSRVIRARYQPKALPPAMQAFRSVLATASIDIVQITRPHRVITGKDFAVFCNDPKNGKAGITDRYLKYAHSVGLELYELVSKPLPTGDGITAALIVGPRH